MARFGETLTYLMKQYGLTAEEIAPKLGYKSSNISKLKRKDDVDTEVLETVCRYFCVSPLMFLSPELANYPNSDDRPTINNKAVLGVATLNIGQSEEVQHLKEQLISKDKLIEEKERLIQILLNGQDKPQ